MNTFSKDEIKQYMKIRKLIDEYKEGKYTNYYNPEPYLYCFENEEKKKKKCVRINLKIQREINAIFTEN